MSTKQPVALAQECADYATSLRSTINVVKLEGRTAPISFLRAAELFERAAARIAELEALAAGYAAARLEIESLHAQFEAVGAGGVSALMAAPAQAVAVPDGWRLVPLEPTSKQVVMLAGALLQQQQGTADSRHPDWSKAVEHAEHAYRAMFEAAPQPAAQALDAKRYQFLRDGEWRDTDLESFIRLQLNTLWDAKIDAAIAAKQGVK